MGVPFLELTRQHELLADEIMKAWSAILHSARFVSGVEVSAFEEEWAQAVGADHCVAVASGTDALTLALRAAGLGPGDRVLVPASTFIATAEAVSHVGAEPRFADVEARTANLSPQALKVMDDDVRAVIPVHLYGQPVDIDAIQAAAGDRVVIYDSAQAHLAAYKDQPVGNAGAATTYSFYPGKNLGAPGEGGAITTDDPGLADTLRMLRDHGQREKYRSEVIGYNARMTELAAAALRIKLPYLGEWTEARRVAAGRYRENLAGVPGLTLLEEPAWARSSYHLFVIRHPARDRVIEALSRRDIGTGLHYPVPLHHQPAFRGLPAAELPAAEEHARSLMSLPMFPELTLSQIDEVSEAVSSLPLEQGAG